MLNKLNTKKEVDNAIKTCEDKVLVLRFGRDTDPVCQQLDDIVRKCNKLSILDGQPCFYFLFSIIFIVVSLSPNMQVKRSFIFKGKLEDDN